MLDSKCCHCGRGFMNWTKVRIPSFSLDIELYNVLANIEEKYNRHNRFRSLHPWGEYRERHTIITWSTREITHLNLFSSTIMNIEHSSTQKLYLRIDEKYFFLCQRKKTKSWTLDYRLDVEHPFLAWSTKRPFIALNTRSSSLSWSTFLHQKSSLITYCL